jgi:hypothetical protein
VRLTCAWRAPGVRLACAWRAPGVRLACAWRAPGVRLACAWRAPGVHHLLADGVHQLAERHGHLPLEIHFTAVFRHHCEIDQLFLLWLQIRRGEGVRRRGGADHAARHLSLSLGTQLKIPNSRFHQLPRQRNIVAPRVGDIKGRGALHAGTTHEVERLRVQN